jgi:hypothetical protein
MSLPTARHVGGRDDERVIVQRLRVHRQSQCSHRFGGISVSTTSLLVTLLLLATSTTRMTTVSTAVAAFEPPNVFPVSVRQALWKKARAINPPDYKYGTAGWSNRAATVLTPVYLGDNKADGSNTNNVYTGDRPFYWNKIDVSCRMTVIELPPVSASDPPSLWVHSPVTADGPMKQVIENMPGKPVVQHVVSTNYEHLKFAPEWAAAYPDANFWGCPGLAKRMPDMPWTGEMPDGYRPAGWKGAAVESPVLPTTEPWWDRNLIQALHVNMEVNPATGRPFFNEVVYFHTVSKTLMVTDLFFNYPASTVPNSEFGRNDAWELAPVVSDIPVGSRLWKKGMDAVYAPFFSTLMVTDKAAFRDMAEHIVNVWQPEIVIPAHGDILRGKDFIRQVLTKKLGL